MASPTQKKDQEVNNEALYQPTWINVEGPKWEKFGYVLILSSFFIMVMQGLALGPHMLWKRADDVTTVLFTFELVVRIFEKGYLFCTEQEKSWNFFDTLVVAISIFSMVIAIRAAQSADGHASNSAMNKMKALRTLRLLRLLRLFRVLKSCPVEKVNNCLDGFLNMIVMSFIAVTVAAAAVALMSTVGVALVMGARAWLRTHELPKPPKID